MNEPTHTPGPWDAAGPELLEACEMLYNELMKSKSLIEVQNISNAYKAINIGSKAIAKAKGLLT